MKRLIIRADDAGSAQSANRAIFECATRGLARNISLMACGPIIEETAEMLVGVPNVDFGLHLTLSAEWDSTRWGSVAPSENVPLLLDEEGFFTRAPNALFERGVSEEMLNQIETEAQAQLDRLRALGFDITYMDEHMGLGWLPGVGERLQVLARRENLLFAAKVPGLPPFEASGSPSQVLGARVEAVPEGDYVFVTHPAYDDAEMQALGNPNFGPGQVAREREADRALLLSEELQVELERRQIRVARYSQVLGSS